MVLDTATGHVKVERQVELFVKLLGEIIRTAGQDGVKTMTKICDMGMDEGKVTRN